MTSFENVMCYDREHKTDSALMVIRGLPDKVDTLWRNYALCIAAPIYKDADIPDTAYIYARELAMSGSPGARLGFKVMFSPELAGIVPKDTLVFYQPIYSRTIEKYLNESEAKEAIIQNTHYNYQLYVREKGRQRPTEIN